MEEGSELGGPLVGVVQLRDTSSGDEEQGLAMTVRKDPYS